MRIILIILTAGFLTVTIALAQKPRLIPSHVMGAQACSECHQNAVDTWRATQHFATFKTLEDSDKAYEIADALDVDDFSTGSLCVECHFTIQNKGRRNTAISGISCESCHGAAKNWIKEHNKESVSRAARKEVSEQAGMLYPENLYAVARNCFDCHIVSREKLVNVGGHPAYSKDFDLAAWSQGEVRHGFMTPASPVKKSGDANRPASPERMRMLFMVGKLLSLEYSLRAVASATSAGRLPSGEYAYGVLQALRANAIKKEVAALNELISTDEVTQILAVAAEVKLKTENKGPLTTAADKISTLTQKFAATHNGSGFDALDAKIPALHGKIFKP